ncbi:molybdopterin-synthase adenylyltransferase MoeB [Parashewanella curva]|uniref:Molybdopterin-synthase adenylyltransferase n=1 Tax=Parashewanella curva TaxID=2338552 RepID=A0A3L8Q1W6_9GAMM|nr:molybdopterin-synthase adenylyltransferase MoeB [Parashewanella curva]RLV60733.1 molybdopterin-synthase adenylyltransferase MoeB [Parashewanella curva]
MTDTVEDLLTDQEMLRYSRQISIKSMDIDGQEKLKQARVLVFGVGGLGCAASQYLAVAGVGHLTLVDFDTVALSNLQRQVLHHDADVGRAKVDSGADSLRQLNPHIDVETINESLDESEISALIANYDVVVDCTDNLTIRQQLNQACFQHKTSLVSGAAIRMEGLLTVFNYQADTPCYQCFSRLFGEQQLSCVESGILAPVIGVIGSLQALEAIKLITQMGEPLIGRILMFDAMTLECREMKLKPNERCTVCR